MIVCPGCQAENPPDAHFCACGEYLGWLAQPGAQAAPDLAPPEEGETALPPPSARAAPAPGVLLSLRRPGEEPVDHGPLALRVAPGGRVRLLALVRNESGIVDSYQFTVTGLPEEWWTVSPRTVYLVPFGARGAYEQEVEVHLHPPRSPEAQARSWPLMVAARSGARAREAAAAPVALDIDPYIDLDAALHPQQATGRRRAAYVATVRNRANAPVDVALAAADAEGACRFRFVDEVVGVGAGAAAELPFVVRPRRPRWIGRPVDRRFELTATAAREDEPRARRTATFRHRAWLPWWVAVAVPLLAAAVPVVLALLPHRVTVPDLSRAAGPFQAQKLLDGRGLKLAPRIGRATRGGAPGAIVEQSPDPGTRVKAGSLVSIAVVPRPRVMPHVPVLARMTPDQADKALADRRLALGTIEPADHPDWRVRTQIPAAGLKRAPGTPVNVFLAGPRRRRRHAKHAKKAAAVPVLAGAGGAAAAQALARKGIATRVTYVFSTARRGTVISTTPGAGAKPKPGDTVTLVVSAGFPRLAFDDGARVLVAGGATGRPVARLGPASPPGAWPSWSPGGTRVAYAAGGRIVLGSARVPESDPLTLTRGSASYGSPAFAPTSGPAVMAFIRDPGGAGDLCLARVGAVRASAPRCIADPGVDLSGPIAWSPRGTQLLVAGAVAGTGGAGFGLFRYATAFPFTIRARLWGRARAVTDMSRPGRGVLAAAWSPDGRRLALISDLGGGGYRLVLTTGHDFALRHARTVRLRACGVAWRPDGRELAVTIGDPECRQTTGTVARLDPARPARLTVVRSGGAHPAWQPLRLGP